MKTLGCLLLLLTTLSAHASSTGTLLLRGHVPARSKVIVDTVRGTFRLQTNTGKDALATMVKEVVDHRGYHYITVTPQ